jgi:hypothetical protein
MTAESFKRQYTGRVGRIGLAAKTKVSRQGTFLGSTVTRSQFSPCPYSEDINGSELVIEEHKSSQSLSKDSVSLGESIEDSELPVPNVLEESEQERKAPKTVGSLPRIEESEQERKARRYSGSMHRIEEN